MPNPFESSEDTGHLEEHLREGIAAREREAVEPSTPMPDPHDGDLDVSLSEDKPPNREEKKANRFKEAQEAREAAEEKARRLEAELAAERAVARRVPAPQEPMEDPLEKEIDESYRQRQQLADDFEQRRQAGTLTEDTAKDFQSRARKLEEKTTELIYQRTQRKQHANRNPAEDRIMEIRRRHADVADNPKAWQYANGQAQIRMARGEQYSQEFVDDVIEEARKEFKIGRYRDGVPREDRYNSAPRGSGPNPGREKPGKIRMTKTMRQMADHQFSDIENPQERYQKWADGPGKRFIELERKQGR